MFIFKETDKAEAIAIARKFIEDNNITTEDLYVNHDDYDYIVEEYVELANNWTIRHGASKLVLCAYDRDYVIKIPLLGERFEKYDETTGELIEDECELSPYKCNYCAIETDVYNAAVIEGIDNIFAAVEYLGKMNGIDIYIQEKVSHIGEDWEPTQNSLQLARSMKGQSSLYISVLAHLLDAFGEEVTMVVMKIVNAFHLNDWHNGNYGFVNNKIKFCDYSGFN